MESNRIEYKRELNESFEKNAVAFLNYHDGGVIYIGIDDSEKVTGVLDADAMQLAIKDRLKNNILPSCMGLFDVVHEKRDGKNIIKVTLASGTEKPYYLKKFGMSEKGCYIRVGSSCEMMPTRIIEDLFASRTRNSIGRIRSPLQDLTFEQLKIYYNEAGFKINDKFAANLELLTEEGDYNYAAYLLADSNGNSTQVAKYAGLDRVDLLDSNEYGYCCLVKTCKQILDKLEVENRTVNKITPKERISSSLWNRIALREAVINAIIHADYTNDTVPKFELFQDRLEITSPGFIHPGEEQENFFAEYSIPRNKILMRIFKDLKMVEYLSSGMPRILKAYPKESYSFSSFFVRMVLPFSKEALALEKDVMIQKDNKAVKTREKTREKIIRLLTDTPEITTMDLSKELEISLKGIDWQITQLKKNNKIRRIGPDKGGHWEIIKKK